MSTETNKAIVRRCTEQLWNRHQTNLVEEFFDEKLNLHIAGMPSQTGLEHVSESVAMTKKAFPDFQIIIEDEVAENEMVVIRWTMRATHQGEFFGIPATGKKITQSGITINRLSNARISELWYLADSMSLFQQIGAVPSPLSN